MPEPEKTTEERAEEIKEIFVKAGAMLAFGKQVMDLIPDLYEHFIEGENAEIVLQHDGNKFILVKP